MDPELFKMNYSHFEGCISDLDNHDPNSPERNSNKYQRCQWEGKRQAGPAVLKVKLCSLSPNYLALRILMQGEVLAILTSNAILLPGVSGSIDSGKLLFY